MAESSNEKSPYIPYASLILWGKDLMPEKITDELGLLPTKSFQRGDIRKNDKKWPHGFWALESKGHIQSLTVVEHIEWVLTKIEPVQKQLAELIQKQLLDAHLSVFWIMPTSHEYLLFEPNLSKQIAALNLRLEISIYSPE